MAVKAETTNRTSKSSARGFCTLFFLH